MRDDCWPRRRLAGGVGAPRKAAEAHRRVQVTPPPPRGPIPKSATAVDRMRRKLRTASGRAIYATRKTIVEPVFGHIKPGRGSRQFLLRAVEKVRA